MATFPTRDLDGLGGITSVTAVGISQFLDEYQIISVNNLTGSPFCVIFPFRYHVRA